jgi:hypothetical protein
VDHFKPDQPLTDTKSITLHIELLGIIFLFLAINERKEKAKGILNGITKH